MALFRAMATVGGYTMLSRLLGFARDVLIATLVGAGTVTDAFFVAFKLPNLFRRLFAEGAFNAAFVPLFAGLLETEGRDTARLFAERALSLLALVLLGLTILVELAMPLVMYVFAPGFAEVPGKMALTTEMSRITFPYLLFISLVSLLSGVLNSLGRFAAAAAAPVILNLCLIGALLGLSPLMPTQGHALAWGVALAGVLQFLWLIWNCHKAGMDFYLPRPRWTPRIRLLVRRIGPGALGAGVYQVNLVVDTILASLVGTGAVSFLFYADRLTQLPLGVVGTAVGIALLPLLSRQIRAGQDGAALDSQNRAVEVALLLTLPAAVALFVVAGPLVGGLFQHGAFSQEDRVATAHALMAFSVGLPAYVLVKVLAPGFFAREDTATPVKVAGVALVANIVLNLLLMGPLGHVGIALATALAQWLNAILLALLLVRRGVYRWDARLKRRLVRMGGACVAFAGVLWLMAWGLRGWTEGDSLHRILAVGVLVVAGLVAYGGLVRLFGAASLSEIKAALRRPQPAAPAESSSS